MSTITATVDLNLPIAPVYDHWTQFETFPQFKEGVGKATDDDLKNEGRTQHGVAKAKDAVKDAASKIKEAARDMTDRDR